MRRSVFLHWLLLVLMILSVNRTLTNAQVSSPLPEETITLPLGAVLEVMADTRIPFPNYSWILTQGENFLQASREKFMRVRLAQPGTYALIAEVFSADRIQTVRRKFIIEVSKEPSFFQPGSGTLIVGTDPATNAHGRLPADTLREVTEFRPAVTGYRSIAMDLSEKTDSDSDGNALNDNDIQGSFLSSQATPLFVWFARPRDDDSIRASAVLQDGTTREQILTFVSAETIAAERRREEAKKSVMADPQPDGRIAFSLNRSLPELQNIPLLFHWDFGDGKQSLLDTPVHAYPQPGTYTVRVSVVNLVSGEEVYNAERMVTVETGTAVSSAMAESSSSMPAEEPSGDGGPSSFLTALRLGSLFLGAVAAGFLLLFVLSRFRRGKSLQQTLENAEKKLMGKQETLPLTPPPLTLNFTETPSAPAIAPTVIKEPASQPIAEEVVPPWLQQSPPQKTPVTPPAAPVVPAQPFSEPMSEPVINPPPAAEPALEQSAQGPVPDWLQPPSVAEPPPLEESAIPAEPAAPPPAQTSQASPADLQREERERERKRLKRQRYRANKRAREEQETAVPTPQPASGTTEPHPPQEAPAPPMVEPNTQVTQEATDEDQVVGYVRAENVLGQTEGKKEDDTTLGPPEPFTM